MTFSYISLHIGMATVIFSSHFWTFNQGIPRTYIRNYLDCAYTSGNGTQTLGARRHLYPNLPHDEDPRGMKCCRPRTKLCTNVPTLWTVLYSLYYIYHFFKENILGMSPTTYYMRYCCMREWKPQTIANNIPTTFVAWCECVLLHQSIDIWWQKAFFQVQKVLQEEAFVILRLHNWMKSCYNSRE